MCIIIMRCALLALLPAHRAAQLTESRVGVKVKGKAVCQEKRQEQFSPFLKNGLRWIEQQAVWDKDDDDGNISCIIIIG